jgi:hypothetical protein
MKKSFHLIAAVVALSILVSAGALWAGPVAPLCPEHGKTCVERAGGMHCSWTENVMVNKLVPGRAGLWGWVRTPTSELKTEKCRCM